MRKKECCEEERKLLEKVMAHMDKIEVAIVSIINIFTTYIVLKL